MITISEFDLVLQQRLVKWAKYIAITVLFISTVVLLGWQADVELLKGPFPALTPMNPVSAIGFILSAVSFLLLAPRRSTRTAKLLGYALAATVFIIGTFRLFGLQVDLLLFPDKLFASISAGQPARMAGNSSFCFAAIGIALPLVHQDFKNRVVPAQLLAVVVILTGMLSLIGHLYNLNNLVAIYDYLPMTLYTTIGFILLGISILITEPQKGMMKEFTSSLAGSVNARTLVPLVIAVPLALGLLRIWTNRSGIFSFETGTAMLVLGMIIVCISLVWHDTLALNKKDLFKKKSEEGMQEIEQNYRFLVTSVKDYAIFMMDPDGIIMTWNEGAQRIKGYSAEEIIGKHISIFYTPEEILSGEPKRNLRIAEKEGRLENEGWRIRQDGSSFWANIVFTAIYNQAGRLQGFAKITRDMTERKGHEQELKRVNEELKESVKNKTEELTQVIERVSDGFMAFNKKGEITFVTRKTASLLGDDPVELIGQNPLTDFSSEPNAEFRKHFSLSLQDQQLHQFETYSKKLDRWYENYLYPSQNGASLFFRDITEKKVIEESLQRSEELRDLIMSSSLDAVICINNNGIITFWNKQAEKIFGWKESEILGKKLTETIIPSNLRQAQVDGLSHYQNTGDGPAMNKIMEMIALNKESKEFPVEVFIVPVKGRDEGFFCAFARDITERKKASEQIAQERNLLRTVIDNIPDYIFVKSRDSTHIVNNAAIVKMIGAKTEEETLGKTVADFFSTKLATEFIRDDRLILEGKSPGLDREYHFSPPSGSPKFLHTTKIPLKDINNKIIGLVGISRDITERKEAQEQIIREKELSDSAINSLPGIFYFFEQGGKFLRWNKNFELVSEYSAEEIRSMTPIDFFDQEEQAFIATQIKKVFSGEIANTEACILTKSGKKIPHFFSGSVIQYLEKPCLIGTAINISERNKVEEELRVSERKYKVLFENNPMPMWILRQHDNRILDVNESALIHYGYTRQEFLAMDATLIRPPEERSKYITASQIHIPGISFRGIWKHRKKDGSIIHVEIFATDYIYLEQKVRLILSNDVSEKLKAEINLQQSYEQIRQLASHLQDIREEERANIAREIHDELGQQLTGLKMDLSWTAKRKIVSDDQELSKKLAGTIDLLDLTIKTVRRIATELRPSILDDLGLIAAIEWQSQEFGRRTGIACRFVTDLTEYIFPPQMAIALFRICQEAMTNVARHSEARNVVTVLSERDDKIILTIMDNGIGFIENKMEGKKTLGLLGMRERTLMLGGEFQIASGPGEGTKITVSVHREANMIVKTG